MSTAPIVVWAEIPVRDLDAAVAFYDKVFDWSMTIDNTGPNPMAMLGGASETTSGHLYPGTPASDGNGPTVHIAVPDTLEATMARCDAAGGRVISPAIEIPPGRFAYAVDPDGNSIGLFEPKG